MLQPLQGQVGVEPRAAFSAERSLSFQYQTGSYQPILVVPADLAPRVQIFARSTNDEWISGKHYGCSLCQPDSPRRGAGVGWRGGVMS